YSATTQKLNQNRQHPVSWSNPDTGCCFILSSFFCADALHVIGTHKPQYVCPGLHTAEEDLPASSAVASGVVVVQLQAEVIAQGIELVVGGLGNEPTAHLTGAGIGHPFMPSQTIVPQALGQH